MDQLTPFREDPDRNRITSIRAEAQKEIDRYLTELRQLRFQRALLLGVVVILLADYIENSFGQPPPTASRQAFDMDATVYLPPPIFFDLDFNEGQYNQIRMRSWWMPSTRTIHRLTPPGRETIACTRGLNCPVHRECALHRPTMLFNLLPPSFGSDAGLSSQ